MSTHIPASFARRDCNGLAKIGTDRFDVIGARFFTDTDGAAGGEPPAEPTAPVPTPPAPTAPDASAEKVEDLPEWAQKRIKELGQESGGYRIKAKEAADQATKDLGDKIAVALGLKPDAAQDPAALTASLTAAQQAHKQSQIQLAVYRASGATGANPDALLDSNTFLASVQSLDPASTDFPTQVKAAITAAVTANPTLKAARAAGASTVDNPGGTGEQLGQITQEQLDRMTPEQIAEAYEKGLLQNLLT